MVKSGLLPLCCCMALSLTGIGSLHAAYGGGGGGVGGGGSSSTPIQQYSGQAKQSSVPMNQPIPGTTGAAKPPLPQIHPILPPPSAQAMSVLFTVPGIATLQGGQWIGTPDLYNIPSSIGLVVEVITPHAEPLPLAEQIIIDKIVPVLKEAGIKANTMITGDTPLPFLHFLFMVYPIEKGYVAYCAARLFESAKLSRVYLKAGINWQVITWEKQELILFPANDLRPQIESTIGIILKDFITQYRVKPDQPKQ